MLYIITYQINNFYGSTIGDYKLVQQLSENQSVIVLNVQPYILKEVTYGK